MIRILNEEQTFKEYFGERIRDALVVSRGQIDNVLNLFQSFVDSSSEEELREFSRKTENLRSFTSYLSSISNTRDRG